MGIVDEYNKQSTPSKKSLYLNRQQDNNKLGIAIATIWSIGLIWALIMKLLGY